MGFETQTAPASKGMLWTGRVISGLVFLAMVLGGIMKLVIYVTRSPDLVKGFTDIEWDVNYALGLGILEITCALIYAIPRTSVLGAILLTGYLGGAIATHARMGEFLVVPQVVLGMLVWGGLFLRDTRLRALIPLRS